MPALDLRLCDVLVDILDGTWRGEQFNTHAPTSTMWEVCYLPQDEAEVELMNSANLRCVPRELTALNPYTTYDNTPLGLATREVRARAVRLYVRCTARRRLLLL